VARLCDEAGLDLWVGDSVVAKPRLEPLTTLAYLAAMTQRARLGTAVLLPALRQATVLAHALANIDQISHGRLVLGLGVGWGLPEIAREWEACGVYTNGGAGILKNTSSYGVSSGAARRSRILVTT
jgi:alkanesulfonate monooxygenase SsuD/methylene tetrahydromethanopterin reductase-like flavin-dependent oxidoreductase (luciferase family)